MLCVVYSYLYLISQCCPDHRNMFIIYMQTEYKQDLAAPGLVESLPEECIREILLRLNDPSDIIRAGESCITMDRIACEKRVWRELVQTHFTKAQVEFVLAEKPELKDNKDWQALHTALRRRYGIRQVHVMKI